ncbi:hypothetical protein H4Q26_004628 [Puccinia striiformis f. sp. tritici PST-130]|nr:hypothetical protein H4Q26_004628 [Puccinia striiformis f. sp. tritici PST-130]
MSLSPPIVFVSQFHLLPCQSNPTTSNNLVNFTSISPPPNLQISTKLCRRLKLLVLNFTYPSGPGVHALSNKCYELQDEHSFDREREEVPTEEEVRTRMGLLNEVRATLLPSSRQQLADLLESLDVAAKDIYPNPKLTDALEIVLNSTLPWKDSALPSTPSLQPSTPSKLIASTEKITQDIVRSIDVSQRSDFGYLQDNWHFQEKELGRILASTTQRVNESAGTADAPTEGFQVRPRVVQLMEKCSFPDEIYNDLFSPIQTEFPVALENFLAAFRQFNADVPAPPAPDRD